MVGSGDTLSLLQFDIILKNELRLVAVHVNHQADPHDLNYAVPPMGIEGRIVARILRQETGELLPPAPGGLRFRDR